MKSFLEKIRSFFTKHYLKVVLMLFTLLVIFFSIPFLTPLWWFSIPQRVTASNITDSQASVSFITKNKMPAFVVLSETKSFSKIPFIKTKKDVGDSKRIFPNYYKSHYFVLDSLKPSTKYYFRIYEGLKNVYEGEFETAPITESLSVPYPVYGQIIDERSKPVVGAIVYFRLKNDSEVSNFLSTYTNKNGKWSIDLGNLRSKDLKTTFQIKNNSLEEIVVDFPDKNLQKAYSVTHLDQPWPDIILK